MRCTVANPDPGAAELALGVQAPERTEQLVRVVHVEADAVVADEDGGLARVLGATGFPPSRVAVVR